MLSLTDKTTTRFDVREYKPDWIFVVQFIDGKIGVGQSGNPSKRIASINSGFNPAVPTPLSVYKILGIKPQNEQRTFAGVVANFCSKVGEDNVIAL